MNRENLQILASHLLNGSLFQSEFDFSKYRCGTAGCAIGECGKLFNDEPLSFWLQEYSDAWQRGDYETVRLIAGRLRKWVLEKFDIDQRLYFYLFLPIDSDTGDTNSWLTEKATAKDVGLLIEHFLETGKYLQRTEEEWDLIREGKLADINNDPYKT